MTTSVPANIPLEGPVPLVVLGDPLPLLPDRMLTNLLTNKQGRARIEVGVLWLPVSPETTDLLTRAEKLRSQDGWSVARLLRECFIEYVNRHHPGNPAIPLTHWTKGEPLSVAAEEKLGPAGNMFNVKCVFCGDYFDTTEDMPQPTCPRCSKREAYVD